VMGEFVRQELKGRDVRWGQDEGGVKWEGMRLSSGICSQNIGT
jgi:hypothetical protein